LSTPQPLDGLGFLPLYDVAKNMVRNMSALPKSPATEGALLAQLAQIERQIADLEGEKIALQRLIARFRRENIALQDVTRKNSFTRILVEKRILERLEKSEGHTTTQDLFREARAADYDLKGNTFRSYLHRLKERGLIDSAAKGYWRLAKPLPPRTT
jgi:DNA-binding transcriptional ArsR family regulator